MRIIRFSFVQKMSVSQKEDGGFLPRKIQYSRLSRKCNREVKLNVAGKKPPPYFSFVPGVGMNALGWWNQNALAFGSSAQLEVSTPG